MTEKPQGALAIIFINYRRTDAAWPADDLAKELKRSFGDDRVFLDLREIDAGYEFAALLEEKLSRTTILIVLIGEAWLNVQGEYERRRLDQRDDWVRKEIRVSLQQQGCKVIPVLIDNAKLPSERKALPKDIAGPLALQHFQLRQANSDDDIAALSRQLEKEGFRRLPDSKEPFSGQEFSDKKVLDVVG